MFKIPGKLKHVLELLTGNILVQMLTISLTPILTRIYNPVVFGNISSLNSLINIFASIACLRLENLIILAKTKKEQDYLFRSILIILVAISIILLAVLFVFNIYLLNAINLSYLLPFWFVIPFGVLLNGFINLTNMHQNAIGAYKIQSLNKVLIAGSFALSSVLLGVLLGGSFENRLISLCISFFIGFLTVIKYTVLKVEWTRIKFKNSIELINNNTNFTIYDVIATILNSSSWQLVPILIVSLFGAGIAGQYSLGMNMVLMPMSIIGNSISQVYIKTLSEKLKEAKLISTYKKTAVGLLGIALPVFLILSIFGESLFSLIFGSEWREAGKITMFLAPWAVVWFLANPLGMALVAFRKQGFSLFLQLANLVTRIGSLAIGYLTGSFYFGLIIFVVSGIIVYGIVIFYSYILCNNHDKMISY